VEADAVAQVIGAAGREAGTEALSRQFVTDDARSVRTMATLARKEAAERVKPAAEPPNVYPGGATAWSQGNASWNALMTAKAALPSS
jgi:hypothetical protein